MDAGRIKAAIDEAWSRDKRDQVRSYIGASSIGDQCDVYLTLGLRGFPDNPIEPRLRRIFALGNKIEDMVVDDLRKAGLSVLPVDPMTGRQWAYEEYGGHVKCHLDGQVLEADDAGGLEIKSMNERLFKKFVDEGVRSSHPKYFDQMQMCMALSGLRWFLFVSYCKNDSHYHCEVVHFDELAWSVNHHRIEVVLGGEARRIAADETDWRCRSCFKSRQCWRPTGFDEDREVPRACRTCANASPAATGGWHCDLHNQPATSPCDEWASYLPKPRI